MLDTNILISACWTPGGLEARTLALALQGTVRPCISTATWAEYVEVLSRKKFSSKQDAIQAMLCGLESVAERFEPTRQLSLAADEDDNRFLECAVAANAAYLITGNLRDYPAACENARVVNAREFLNIIGAYFS